MADSAAEARIRDLKRRLELEPGSRLFVALAEEYRKTGQLSDALSTLQKGLLAHPSYLSAHVALGRAYLESGQITEAIATFSRVLANDPGNLVSAKSLADIYLSRGESVEAIKKYKLYRALSGDRTVDDIVARLEMDLAPPPPATSDAKGAAASPPPPPTFYEGKTGPIRSSREVKFGETVAAPAMQDFDVTSVKFEPDDSTASGRPAAEPMPMSRDTPLTSSRPAAQAAAALPEESEATTRAFRIAEVLESGGESEAGETESGSAAGEPQGRVLADLYFAQGHYTEALRIYDELVAASPFDADLKRMRREAEARLLPAATTPLAAGSATALERRLAKVRALKRWLAVVQTG